MKQKREVYDLVTKWKRKYPEKTMAQAFDACRVHPGTYYAQKKRIGGSSRRATTASYEAEPLLPVVQAMPYDGGAPVRPGMVALVGAPEDLARMLLAVGGRQ